MTKAKKATKTKVRPYVIVRGRMAGVHAGELISQKGTSVVLANARRIWKWSGAASLSELAVYGAKNTSECRFGCLIDRQEILGDVCEIIYCKISGEEMIRNQPEWRA